MKARIFTVPFDPVLARFDDSALQEFLAGKDLVDLRDHFFVYEGQPHLALVIEYCLKSAEPAPDQRTRRRAPHWRDLIEPADVPLFNDLREWRTGRSRDEGVPPYVICSNKQLAEVIRKRPRSLAKLAEVEGFGSAKVRKYGPQILGFFEDRAESKPGEGDKGGNAGQEPTDG